MPSGHYVHKCTDIKIRFFNKIKKTTSCWIWIAYRNPAGYGVIGKKGQTGNILAHRLSYIIHNGKIPKKYCVCHSCDNPFCVNPKHLFLGKQQDNMNDMVKKGRYKKRNIPKGEDAFHAKLTWKKVSEIRRRYIRGVFGVPRLAKIYSVNNKTMFSIIHNRTWKI